MASRIILSLGSNCDASYVARAVDWLRDRIEDFQSSSLYETPPAKGVGIPYVNAVIAGRVSADFDTFNNQLKEYEKSAGRDSACRAQGRVPIDIDIVIWNDEILRPWDYRQNFFQIGYRTITQ